MKKSFVLPMFMGIAALASQNALATCAEIDAAASPHVADVTTLVQGHTSGGYGLPMWVGIVDETGKICNIRNTAGTTLGAQIGNSSWLGSRQIAVQKANAANAFSLDIFSIATANLYGLTLPGGSLYGLQASNPTDGTIAYRGAAETYGTDSDPLIGKRIGGVNVFGGGLALYNASGVKIGAVGVSGDTSCTDHAIAWQIRHIWGLDHVPGGFVSGYSPAPGFTVKGDEMIIRQDSSLASVQNSYKQVSCAHNAISNPPQGATWGVIYE